MEWLDVWKDAPSRDKLILVLAGGIPYIGTIIGYEKLRKVYLLIDFSGEELEFCPLTPKEDRITHWCELPELCSDKECESDRIAAEIRDGKYTGLV